MQLVEFECSICNKKSTKTIGHFNRAKKLGLNIFCSRKCFGISRRENKTIDQKKQEKAQYDKDYRNKNKAKLKKQKAEYFQKDYAANPEKYKQERERRKEYNHNFKQTKEYKKYKKEYDKNYNAKKKYGEFWESSILLNEIRKECPAREAKPILGLINKSQNRKRNYEKIKR